MTRGNASTISAVNGDAGSRLFAQLGASSIEADELSRSGISGVPMTKRTENLFRKMTDEESLSLTPDKQDNYYLGHNNATNLQ
jgi:hypothetical protein